MSKEDKYEQLRQVCLSYRNEVEELREKLHKCMPYEDAQEFEDFIRNSEKEKYNQQISDLEAELAERERQYETLYKLFSEQHEIIDQNELECFEEVNRLLKEQKDFYVVEKTEYEKMKQGAKDIVMQLKQQLAEKDLEIERLKQNYDEVWEDTYFSVKEDFELNNNCNECRRYYEEEFNKQLNQDKISFAVEQLEKVRNNIKKVPITDYEPNEHFEKMYKQDAIRQIDNQIKQLKEGK